MSKLFRKVSHNKLIFVVFVILISLSMVGANAQEEETVLVFANNLDPTTLDPHVANDAQSNIFKLAFYEGLVRWAPGTLELEPWLAESWETSEDGLVWTFNIRQGVMFHDGTMLNAEAVKFSIERMKTINQGLAFVLDKVSSVDVLDEHTVQVTLSEPDVTFFQGLPGVMIISSTALTPHMDTDNGTQWAYDHVAGTGPYVLDSWDRGRSLEVVSFSDYWGGWDYPHIDRFIELVVEEPGTRRLMLENGDIDLLPKLEDQIDDVPAIRANPDLVVQTFPTMSIVYLVMSNHRGPLADPLVRQAVSYAFDYQALLEVGFGGVATQPRGPLNSTTQYYDPDLFQYQRDLDRARELLTQAGYPNGGFDLRFGYVGSSGVQRRTAEILQASLAEVGINVITEPQTWPTLLASFQDPETAPDMFNLNNHPAFPDPDYTFSRFFSEDAKGMGGFNGGYYTNETVNNLISTGRVTQDPVERGAIYAQVQETMVADTPAIWAAEMVFMIGHVQGVQGIQYIPAFSRTLGYLNTIYFDR